MIRPLPWERPYAVGAALKRQKKFFIFGNVSASMYVYLIQKMQEKECPFHELASLAPGQIAIE